MGNGACKTTNLPLYFCYREIRISLVAAQDIPLPAMKKNILQTQIADLKLLIEFEYKAYDSALLGKASFDALKEMRLNIRTLKRDLQLLIDKDTD